jgi:glucosamine 6-phosphate synthetase-like amidotransferase/phosphosugar isomerase protein
MCGIAALLLHPQERSPEQWRALTDLFTRNLVYNEARGPAATGIAILQRDGTIATHKMPLPASQFTQTAEYRALLARINAHTTIVLGHTRLPTKGSPLNNANNHPLHAGPVWGVHNGHIKNDDELFARYGYARQAEVDSEIIFQFLAEVAPTSTEAYLRAITQRLRWLDGDFTFLACDQRAPTQLLVLKHNNPLCAHWHTEWNALIFSSRYVFLRQAFGHPVSAEALPHHQLTLFDALALPQHGLNPITYYALPQDHGIGKNFLSQNNQTVV